MPVELRKRKANQLPTEPAPAKRTSSKDKVAKVAAKVKEVTAPTKKSKSPPAKKASSSPEVQQEEEKVKPKTKSARPEVGDEIDLEGFGGEIETHEGVKTTLKKLAEESGKGVVLFTYPKASTPGCTKQACGFRDAYEPLTATGLSIFGLSADSPKSNTSFKTKQNLPYPLLCDVKGTLIKAIGLQKSPKGTQRGVFVVTKEGKVLAAEAGSPGGTVERVQEVVKGMA